MCNCTDKVNKSLEPYNTILDEVSMLNMSTGVCRQSLHLVTGKRERKKGKARVVLVNFCPFCGDRYAPLPEEPAFTQIIFEGEHVASKMPAAETVVEVMLTYGERRLAWFDANISEPGDWDFLPVGPDNEPIIDADSLADQIVAWRAAS